MRLWANLLKKPDRQLLSDVARRDASDMSHQVGFVFRVTYFAGS